jgi:agmatinase
MAERVASVAAIILAAGASRRMGSPKALLPVEGETFLGRLVATHRSAGIDPIVVVVGPDGDRVAAAVDLAGVRLVRNLAPESGPLASLRLGLAALDPEPEALLLQPVDHPLVRPETVRRLVSAWAAGPHGILIPTFGARRGHPTLFARRLFAALRVAPLDQGARAVVRGQLHEVREVPVDDPGVRAEVDTPADYDAVIGRPRPATGDPREENAVVHSFQPIDSFRSPRFSQPPTFMRLPHSRDLAAIDIALIGIPFDGGTSYRPGARFGPREVRAQSSMVRPYNPVLKANPFQTRRVADYGDIDVAPVSIERTYEKIEAALGEILRHNVLPVSVGGDHSITHPILRAVAERHGPVALIHIDAHLDTWDTYFGGKYFHGTPFRRAVEEGLIDPRQTIQVGIRGPLYGEDDFDFQARHGMVVVPIGEVKDRGVAAVAERWRALVRGPVYVSFDIDSVDPAYAPGTGTPEVGGLTSTEALGLVRALKGLHVVGFDLVEVSPLYDGPGQITALLAANLLYEFLCTLPPR